MPETLYLRGDGGSESVFLAIIELLMARRLIKVGFFERLPVGHTPENLDGVFSRIWTRMRDRGVITPQDYRRLVMGILRPK